MHTANTDSGLDPGFPRGERAEVADYALEVGMLSEGGRKHPVNEDHCGQLRVDATTVLVVVADGVSTSPAGDTASRMAVEITLRAFREQDPRTRIDLRLARAVQKASIEIYDLAVVVPELRGMATTVTAVIVTRGRMLAAHVGDSRLYLVRGERTLQLTKDHTGRKSGPSRTVGRELLVAIDRLSRPLQQNDVLVICTDGLYNVVPDRDLGLLVTGLAPDDACRALVDAAVARQSHDNTTAAVIRLVGPIPDAEPGSVPGRLLRLLTRPR
ncbi:MAG: protein serine/threonine phosphatase [Myxococcales bacterium]|nr:protein serine/threonine phosphatase [Myxococcales bacterium]